MHQAYAESYEELAQINIEKSNIDRTYLHHLARNVVNYVGDVRGKTVCDVGVGQGSLCRELLAAGAARVTGIDVAVSFLKNLPEDQRIERVLANAENLPYQEAFDVLVSTDVMEHVVDLGSYLYCVNRALRPGGIACIRVPYMKTVIHHSPFLGYPHAYGHLRAFDEPVLRMLATSSGFEVVRMVRDGFSLGMPNAFFSRPGWPARLYARLQARLMSKLENPADINLKSRRFCRMLMLENELVLVARKSHRIERVEPRGYSLVPVNAVEAAA